VSGWCEARVPNIKKWSLCVPYADDLHTTHAPRWTARRILW